LNARQPGGAEGASFTLFIGFERTTARSSAGCSPRLSYLGVASAHLHEEYQLSLKIFFEIGFTVEFLDEASQALGRKPRFQIEPTAY